MNKFLVKELDLKRSKKSVLKNKKSKISKIIKGTLVGMSVFFAGTSLASEKATTIKQQEYNIALINRINVGDKINSSYDSYLKAGKVDLGGLRKNISNSTFVTKGQKYTYINIDIPQLTEAHKISIDSAIELLNEINEKTYTNNPKLVVNYSPTFKDFANPTSVSVYSGEFINSRVSGKNLAVPFFTTNGLQTAYNFIRISEKNVTNPIHFASVLTHELMHALYGVGDNYLVDENESCTSIMNSDDPDMIYTFLSLNDVKMIDYLSWKSTLSEEQISNVKNFYEYYNKKYLSNQGTFLRVVFYEKLFEKSIISTEKILEAVNNKFILTPSEKDKITPISKEAYYHTVMDTAIEGKTVDVQENNFVYICPNNMETTTFSIDYLNNGYVYNKEYQNTFATKIDNFTLFGSQLFFEYAGHTFYVKVDNDDLSYSVKEFMPRNAPTSQADYMKNQAIQNEVYEACKNFKTSSYDDIAKQVVYRQILADFNFQVFKESFDIDNSEYKLDENFGSEHFTYNFSINDSCDLRLVCETENRKIVNNIYNNKTNSKIQTLSRMDHGVLIGKDMAFIKIGNKIIGMMIEHDKIIKDVNGLYGENISIDYNLSDSYENSSL